MKKKILTCCCFLSALCGVVSCNSSDEVEPWWQATIEAAYNYINELKIEAGDTVILRNNWKSGKDIYSDCEGDSVFHVPNYDNFYLAISLQLTKNGHRFYVEGEKTRAYWDFLQEKRGYVEKEKPKNVQKYVYAGIKQGASLTADKILFGIEPGGNLGEYMKVDLSDEQKIRVNYPDFDVVQNYYGFHNEVLFSNYFKEETALSLIPYMLFFTTAPKECYDEITFSIEIPIKCDYFQKIISGIDYPEEYYEKGLVDRNENRVLRGSVTVKFEELSI